MLESFLPRPPSRQSLPGRHYSPSARLHSNGAIPPLLTPSALSPGNHQVGGHLSIPSDPLSAGNSVFPDSPGSPGPRLHGYAQSWPSSEHVLRPALKRANPAPSPARPLQSPASPRPGAQLGQWPTGVRVSLSPLASRVLAEGRGLTARPLGCPTGLSHWGGGT